LLWFLWLLLLLVVVVLLFFFFLLSSSSLFDAIQDHTVFEGCSQMSSGCKTCPCWLMKTISFVRFLTIKNNMWITLLNDN
jgi:hypothetical protein